MKRALVVITANFCLLWTGWAAVVASENEGRPFESAIGHGLEELAKAGQRFQARGDGGAASGYVPINPDILEVVFFTLVNQVETRSLDQVIWQTKFQSQWLLALATYGDPNDTSNFPIGTTRELFGKLYRSVSVLAHYAQFNGPRLRSLELAQALLPAADVARALGTREGAPFQNIGQPDLLYPVLRGIKAQLYRSGGGLNPGNRDIAIQLLEAAVKNAPYVKDRTDRQFTTVFLIHDLVHELFPTIPTRQDRFKDWKITKIDGEIGGWIDGLSDALTLSGRKANVDRLLPKLKTLP